MSYFDFTAIRKNLPKHAKVWDALERWTNTHPDLKAVPVLDLALELRESVGFPALLEAINDLVSFGQARKVFRIMDPTIKVLLPTTYKSRGEVPNKIQNNWDTWIDVTPQDVAMVLESAS